MEPTLFPGDFIIVNKMIHGGRLWKIRKLFKDGKIESLRVKGFKNIKKGEVLVFNWPNYGSLSNPFPNIYGDYVVKRCLGCPGDTILIKEKGK